MMSRIRYTGPPGGEVVGPWTLNLALARPAQRMRSSRRRQPPIFTVIVAVPVTDPDFARIVVVPGNRPVTLPLLLTDATRESELDHVKLAFGSICPFASC